MTPDSTRFVQATTLLHRGLTVGLAFALLGLLFGVIPVAGLRTGTITLLDSEGDPVGALTGGASGRATLRLGQEDGARVVISAEQDVALGTVAGPDGGGVLSFSVAATGTIVRVGPGATGAAAIIRVDPEGLVTVESPQPR